MLKITCSLLNSWLHATDADADENAYQGFLDTLERKKAPRTAAIQQGIDFENAVTAYINSEVVTPNNERELSAITQIGNKLRRAQLQVRAEKAVTIAGRPFLLVGIADALKAGVLYDIKRPLRYEYGKYQQSAQHAMYFELFPEAFKFRYLIFDGSYLYAEDYRRGEHTPIEQTILAFVRYLEDAGLMDVYKKNWRGNE